ncbi:MAG: hypothetical protein GX081_09375 [Firmicutes bacterium]|nr:hypothetical protein [Bacillota bacterium]
MGRSRSRWLVLCLMLAVVSLPVQAGLLDIYGLDGWLLLLNSYVRLGELKTDPIDPALEYFESEGALSFLFGSIDTEWQMFLSGTDFQSGMDRIPLERMEWKISGGDYRRMPAAGREVVIMRGDQNSSWLQMGSLSFRLVLRGDEKPGTYSSTLFLTMVFP